MSVIVFENKADFDAFQVQSWLRKQPGPGGRNPHRVPQPRTRLTFQCEPDALAGQHPVREAASRNDEDGDDRRDEQYESANHWWPVVGPGFSRASAC